MITKEPPYDLIVKFATSTSNGRRILAKKSLKYMAAYYLDRHLWPCQESWNRQLRRISRGGIVSQPGAGKTELVARFIPLDLILHGIGDIGPRDIRIGCISASDKLATQNVSLVRQDLESQKLIEDYGVFKPKRGLWGETAFTVVRPGRFKDPTYSAFGIGGAVIGFRFDVLILDDPLKDEKQARNPDIMAQMIETVEGTIRSRLQPGGVLWFLGNRKGAQDLYRRFIDNPNYTVIISPGLIREPENYQVIELDHLEIDEYGHDTHYRVEIGEGDPGEALCPECWPVARLLRERKERGSIIFNREYQGQVTDDETALIKRAWLDAAKDLTRSYGVYNRSDYIEIIQGMDPALTTNRKEAERQDTDYTVLDTMGLRENGHIDLLDTYRDRGLSPNQIHQVSVDQYQLHHPRFQFIETNSFGEFVHWKLQHETNVPVQSHKTTGKNKYDPYEGIPSLSVLFENGQVSLPYRTERDKEITDRLCAELYNPLESNHDDQLSAFWITYHGARRLYEVRAKLKRRGRSLPDATKTQIAETALDLRFPAPIKPQEDRPGEPKRRSSVRVFG